MNVQLTPGQIRAVLDAISQMTDGNGRDFGEWHMQTHGNKMQWNALINAERILANTLHGPGAYERVRGKPEGEK